MNTIEVKYKTNFFSEENKIVFSDRSISLLSNNHVISKIEKEEIHNVRYGTAWIKGIDFTIGRIYCIDINNNQNTFIRIRLRSIYGINKNKLWKKYQEILDLLYDYYLNEKILQHINNIEDGIDLEMSGITFKKEGVLLNSKGESRFINWDDLNSVAYTYYYTLSSKKEPDLYKAFTYLTDWNAVILLSISRQLLINKGLYTK